MLFQVKSYCKFLFKSTNQHGVHSPFVYDFVTKCLYDQKSEPEYPFLKNYRKALLKYQNFIEVTDFGAGSSVFKNNTRQISSIAKTAGISSERANLLLKITKYFKPDNILEIGTSLGLATSALAFGSIQSKIVTLEGCPETANIAQEQFDKFELDNVTLIIGEFANYFKNPIQKSFQLIYFDGNHQKQTTLSYFTSLLHTVNNDTVWIFDDIHWSSEMEEAWEVIIKNPLVTVTIDTFQWGLIFFRKEQEKQHFIIRI